ncbi:MAG TPA: hypothetical protein VHD83_03815 [Puia sp.]|nr:hypothetical protein [Puia sp.]
MQLQVKPHIFTPDDHQMIESLGYVFDGLPDEEEQGNFLRSFLPNFDILHLLVVVEQNFASTTSLPLIRRLIYDKHSNNFRIYFSNNPEEEEDLVVFDRTFYRENGELIVNHNYCIVPVAHQNKGLIKPVFQASLQQYVNMGVRKIKVHAGLGGGGYAWARHGFVAEDPEEVRII